MSHRSKLSRWTIAALVCAASALCWTGCEGEPAQPPESATPAATTTTVSAPETSEPQGTSTATMAVATPTPNPILGEIIAVSNYGPVTREDLIDAAAAAQILPLADLRPSRHIAREQIALMGEQQLTSAARWVVSRRGAYDHLQSSETEETRLKYRNAWINGPRRVAIFTQLVDQEIDSRLPRPTEAEIAAYYEQHKPEYHHPFQFRMRHLILLTLVQHEVSEGETLESIAEQISGNAALANQIRSDSIARPLRREEGKEFRPLIPGEKLLVPMKEADAQEVRAKLDEHLKELESGVTFEELAAKYSNAEYKGAEVGPLPSGTRDILPELMEQAQATTVGQLSPVFRTKYGWQVIQVTDKKEEGYYRIADVRDSIVENIIQQERESLIGQFKESLFGNPNLVIEVDTIARANEATSTDTVIARIADTPIYWTDYREIWAQSGRPTTEREIRFSMQGMRVAQEMLAMDWAEQMIKDPNNPMAKILELSSVQAEGQMHMSIQARNHSVAALTTDSLMARYEEVKDAMFQSPPEVTYVAMERRLTPEQQMLPENERRELLMSMYQQMKVELAEIKGEAAFREKANAVNAALGDANPPAPRADQPVSVTQLDEQTRAVAEGLEAGQASEPVLVDNHRLISYFLVSKEVHGHIPFEQVSQTVVQMEMQELMETNMRELEEHYLRQANFQSKL